MKKLQCEECKRAKKGEPLYLYNEQILCPFCLAALLTESGQVNVENVGAVGDYEKNTEH